MRRELEAALQLARTLPPGELPFLIGELETVRAFALARITAPAPEARFDELLDVGQTSKRLNVSRNYLYRNSRRFPFTKRVGRKLLFSAVGLDAYLRRTR